MNLSSRKILDRSFTGFSIVSVLLLAGSLLIVLGPIFMSGIKAFIFKGTTEFRRFNFEKFNRGSGDKIREELESTLSMKRHIYKSLEDFHNKIENEEIEDAYEYIAPLKELEELVLELIGPNPDLSEKPVLMRDQYGSLRGDKALEAVNKIKFAEIWVKQQDGKGDLVKKKVSRKEIFKNKEISSLIDYIDNNWKEILKPKLTFYWQFLKDVSFDSHFFGGIGTEVKGTFYLVLWTMLLSIPIGILTALYLAEFAGDGKLITIIRTCISTLAGVPSIVFGLFGLAFFINTLRVSESKSVIAGALTLSILVLPTIIRTAEEAIRAVPKTYKEASLSLGASRFKTVFLVLLPAALPGILTGIVISMGRAAGETAPIIFTAAVSVGNPLKFTEVFSQPTPTLSWNIYNLVAEHEAVDQIRHIQFGMVLTLISLVLLLNLIAIMLRARIAKKLRG